MEPILDDNTDVDLPDETRVNAFTYVARYIVCLYLTFRLVSVLMTVFSRFEVQLEYFIYLLGLLLSAALFICFVFYNLKQAALEKSSSYVYPSYRPPFIILFIIYSLIQIYLFLRWSLPALLNGYFDWTIFSALTFGVLLMFIVFRELVYLKRSRMKPGYSK